MAAQPTAAGTPKKDRATQIGTGIGWIILGLVILWAWISFHPGRTESYRGIGTPIVIPSQAVATTTAGTQTQGERLHPAVQYLDINPNALTGFNVNSYAGGGNYIHWQLDDLDVTMDVYVNGNLVGREYARKDQRWTPIRIPLNVAISRVDFKMTPGYQGMLKTTARVAYWYDDSPTDENR